MANRIVQCSRNQIKKIGKKIRNGETLDNNEEQIFTAWLNGHFEVIKQAQSHIKKRIKKVGIDREHIFAKRTKRLDSIKFKLNRYKHLQLDSMQDIAGMRIICNSLDGVKKLIKDLQDHYGKNDRIFQIKDINNYIEQPKEDGYRSCHLILKHVQTGYFIEIQIRTALQHSWATAVEILDMLHTSKIKQGDGKRIHREFFKLCSTFFSRMEKTDILDEFKTFDDSTICYFLEKIDEEHRIINTFQGLVVTTKEIMTTKKKYFYFVVALDIEEKIIVINPFKENHLENARKKYNQYEKQKKFNVVLISIDDCNSIQKAYPNYYLNSQEFIEKIKDAMKRNKISIINKIINYFIWIKWRRKTLRQDNIFRD